MLGLHQISVYLPPTKVSNEDLSNRFEEFTADEIFKKSGVRTRYRTTSDIISSDMAFSAALKLLEKGFTKGEIDLLIFCAESNDYKAPATACLLQDRLGLNRSTMAFDVPLGCSGFVYSLGVVKGMISSGMATKALILLGETPSFVSPKDDFSLVSIFSDAGAAVTVDKKVVDSLGDFIFGTDGSGAYNLFVDQSATRNPANEDWIDNQKINNGMLYGQMKMDGIEVFKFSLREVPKLIQETLEKNNETMDDIDLFVFHQASPIILKSLQRKLRIPDERFANYMELYGNTVSVSIPLALKCSLDEGRIKEGSKVLIAGFGIGYSWGATIIYY